LNKKKGKVNCQQTRKTGAGSGEKKRWAVRRYSLCRKDIWGGAEGGGHLLREAGRGGGGRGGEGRREGREWGRRKVRGKEG